MKNWNYINGAEVGNEAKVTPVDPSPKTGSKPNPDNNQNPKKNPKKEMTDKNGRTFREVLEEVKKTSNSTEKLFYGLSKDAEKEEEKSDEALDELKKTENRIIEKESEMSQELKNLLKKAPEWIKEKIQFAFSHGFTIDEKDYINAIKKEVGNYKTGTSKLKPGDKVESYGVKGVVKSIKGENEDNIYGEPLIEVEFNSGVKKVVPEHYLIKVGNSKTGNSTYTESDRKRLYELARKHNKTAQEWAEFDELNRKEEKASEELIKRIGKNKTGNYSNLARARNAMNKKCGNSQITLWKGNNSALVSDDGLVQYLENNAFETDRDKYDSQQTAIEELKKLGYRKK